MQQAIYSNSTLAQTSSASQTSAAPRRTTLLGRLARKWDLIGVLALMASSAAYGLFELAHLA